MTLWVFAFDKRNPYQDASIGVISRDKPLDDPWLGAIIARTETEANEIRQILVPWHGIEPLWHTHRRHDLADRDARTVALGISWGIRWSHRHHWQRRIRYQNGWHFINQARHPGDEWTWTAEDAMVKHLKAAVTEGLTERVFLALDHWSKRADILAEWQTAKSQITGPDAAQRIARTQRWVDAQTIPANANHAHAVIEFLEVEAELKRQFDAATTFAQTEAVCAKFISGTFGEDWHVPDFFLRDRHYTAWAAQEAQIKQNREDYERTLLGHVRNPFGTALLKPFLKARPHLARLYG